MLHSADGAGASWEEVEGFPAGVGPPAGADPITWDGDGDRCDDSNRENATGRQTHRRL